MDWTWEGFQKPILLYWLCNMGKWTLQHIRLLLSITFETSHSQGWNQSGGRREKKERRAAACSSSCPLTSCRHLGSHAVPLCQRFLCATNHEFILFLLGIWLLIWTTFPSLPCSCTWLMWLSSHQWKASGSDRHSHHLILAPSCSVRLAGNDANGSHISRVIKLCQWPGFVRWLCRGEWAFSPWTVTWKERNFYLVWKTAYFGSLCYSTHSQESASWLYFSWL